MTMFRERGVFRPRDLVAAFALVGLAGCPGNMTADGSADASDVGGDGGGDTRLETGVDVTDTLHEAAADAPPDITADVPDAGTTCTDTRPLATVTMFADCGAICTGPTDAVFNAAGTTAYFTAFTPTGAGAVFSATMGGTPTMLTGGFQSPIGLAISPDDTTLYVLDLVNDSTSAAPRTDLVEGGSTIYRVTISSMSQTPAPLSGMGVITATAIAMSANGQSLLLASSASDTVNGLYSVSTTGGAPSAVATGMPPFVDPAGLAVSATGTVFVNDTRGGGLLGTVISVTGSTATARAPTFVERFPAGIAVGCDNATTLVAGWAPGGTNKLSSVAADGVTVSAIASSSTLVSPTGLHRALNVNAYVVADDGAGTNGVGAIFAVTP